MLVIVNEPLPKVAYLILGMLSAGHDSGYAITRTANRSTRFFWAASDGQVYPQLRKLAEAGLIEGSEEATGARNRTSYRLTPSGRRALEEWLTSEEIPSYELRDEGLLRLFFADELSVAQLRAQVDLIGQRHEHVAWRLREIEPRVGRPASLLTLRLGLALQNWVADWYAQLEQRLADEDPDARAADVLERVLAEHPAPMQTNSGE